MVVITGTIYTEPSVKDYTRGLEHLKRAVELGHPDALKPLGDYYKEVLHACNGSILPVNGKPHSVWLVVGGWWGE